MKTFIRRYDLSPFRLARDISYALAGAALLIALYVSVATASPNRVTVNFWCFDGEALDTALRGGDNVEVPLVSGIGSGGVAMLIYVNQETKAWSFVIVQPDGRACMVGAGEDFETADTDMFPPKKGGGI